MPSTPSNSSRQNLYANLITDWPVWWRELSLPQKLWPLVSVALYWLALCALGGFRHDHLSMGLIILAMNYAGRIPRVIFRFLLPFALTAIIYDSQRFYADFLRGPVHVTQPYEFDKRFFGIETPQGRLTPNEYWQLHTSAVLDFITGLLYLIFFSLFMLIAAYFRFGSGERYRSEARLMGWSFFWTNMIGYTTYYWYAAAPPWYVAQYGLGPAKMDVPASSGGCVRFDLLLGTHFFSEMYGRAADVFGAIPSLHIAYPLIATLFAFRFKRLRVFCVLFYFSMCFSAVYLNHHYILDILWGSTYAVLTTFVIFTIHHRNLAGRAPA